MRPLLVTFVAILVIALGSFLGAQSKTTPVQSDPLPLTKQHRKEPDQRSAKAKPSAAKTSKDQKEKNGPNSQDAAYAAAYKADPRIKFA